MCKRSIFLVFLTGVMYAGVTYAGETLYNGIELPDKWPPAYDRHPKQTQMPVPYLKNPPR
jgi:hypothetical protein